MGEHKRFTPITKDPPQKVAGRSRRSNNSKADFHLCFLESGIGC